MGLLLLDVYQPRLSWQIQEEVDPVQWSVIVGNIGGAWGEAGSRWDVKVNHAQRSPSGFPILRRSSDDRQSTRSFLSCNRWPADKEACMDRELTFALDRTTVVFSFFLQVDSFQFGISPYSTAWNTGRDPRAVSSRVTVELCRGAK